MSLGRSFTLVETDSGIEQIYVRLLEEGTEVFRPVEAKTLGRSKFKILDIEDYGELDEIWEFPPGSIVFCKRFSFGDSEVFLAVRFSE